MSLKCRQQNSSHFLSLNKGTLCSPVKVAMMDVMEISYGKVIQWDIKLLMGAIASKYFARIHY